MKNWLTFTVYIVDYTGSRSSAIFELKYSYWLFLILLFTFMVNNDDNMSPKSPDHRMLICSSFTLPIQGYNPSQILSTNSSFKR